MASISREVEKAAFEQTLVDSFREARSPRDPMWLRQIRRDARERLDESGFPTVRDEHWKYTNVAPILKVPFVEAPAEGPSRIETPREGTQLVFVNGRFAAALSSTPHNGVQVGSLREVLATQPELAEPHLGRVLQDGNAFALANAAALEDGAFVRIPRGTVSEEPIHLVFVSEPVFGPTVSHPRNLIVLDAESHAAVVETYIGAAGETYLTNSVTEVVLGAGANLDLYKVERESTSAYHVATTEVRQERDSRFASHSLSFGGALARNDLNVRLDAEGADCTLNGLFIGSGTQHLDNHTLIDHAKPHGTSRELYKGIMAGKSRGIFHGTIIVRPDAQKTDAMQTNKNILLSKEALVNSTPALEIFADDVKCRHGSTIGQLDEGAIFYMRARGIGEAEARSMLVSAFANDVASRIRIAPLRALVEEHLARTLPGGTP
jgi:Fe-S cluster assembly protein SufD